MTVAGKSLKLYFALNPDDYRDSPIPVQDASEKGIYAEIPLVFKVRFLGILSSFDVPLGKET